MGPSMKPHRALLLFHLRVGVRLASRVLAPVLAATVFLYFVLKPEFTLELARILFVEGGLLESGLAGTLLLLGLARLVVPRIAAGSAGWFRSLPVGRRARHLSAGLSVIIAEIPLLFVPAGLLALIMAPNWARIATSIASLVVGAAAAGLAVLPSASARWTKLILFAACFISFAGRLPSLAASSVLLILAAVWPEAGPPTPRPRGARRDVAQALFFPALSLRAIKGGIAFAYVPAAVVLAAARLFLNNNRSAPRLCQAVSFLALGLSLVAFIGPAAAVLGARRPPWPWLRSLPTSSAARIRRDALLLALLALPLTAGLAVLARPAWEIVYILGPLIWLAVRAAGAIREAGERPFGVIGQVGVEGAILSLALAVLPAASLLLAPALPVAFLLARNSERRLKPTRWAARHHLDAGDPLSWSAP
jgi:hypothetical protein